jgi:hypothetical protein
MANTILTPLMITREALRILHQKCTFISSINRDYDDSFAQKGAKIGDLLRIRLPNQYTVRNGINMATQDTVEQQVFLQVNNVKGVDLNFTSQELTLSLDDFSKRIIEPAMAVLAANIEADVLSMRRDVYQQVNNVTGPMALLQALRGRQMLQDSLTPAGDRTALLSSFDNVQLVNSISGLFNDTTTIAKQYREGYMGRTAGFDFMESTHLSTQARGNFTGYLVNGAGQTTNVLNVDTGTGLIDIGSVFTIPGVNRVHPETKVDTGVPQQFVVLNTVGSPNVTQLVISPEIFTTGAYKNVTNSPADNAVLNFAGTANTPYGQSMVYHKDAFTFATADLVLPQGVDFAAREVMDGISMSLVRQFQISDRSFPCRLDVLYGYKTLRPQLAARIANQAPS